MDANTIKFSHEEHAEAERIALAGGIGEHELDSYMVFVADCAKANGSGLPEMVRLLFAVSAVSEWPTI